jgi:hypothetical protein
LLPTKYIFVLLISCAKYMPTSLKNLTFKRDDFLACPARMILAGGGWSVVGRRRQQSAAPFGAAVVVEGEITKDRENGGGRSHGTSTAIKVSITMILFTPFPGFLGRDSPIVKYYPQIKNPCFVTCVNSALCSKS